MGHVIHCLHDYVVKWKHFPRYWPFLRGIHRSPVNSPHKGQWRQPLMFSLICVWINGWVNNGEAGDLRCHRAHNDVAVTCTFYDVTLLDSIFEFESYVAMVRENEQEIRPTIFLYIYIYVPKVYTLRALRCWPGQWYCVSTLNKKRIF